MEKLSSGRWCYYIDVVKNGCSITTKHLGGTDSGVACFWFQPKKLVRFCFFCIISQSAVVILQIKLQDRVAKIFLCLYAACTILLHGTTLNGTSESCCIDYWHESVCNLVAFPFVFVSSLGVNLWFWISFRLLSWLMFSVSQSWDVILLMSKQLHYCDGLIYRSALDCIGKLPTLYCMTATQRSYTLFHIFTSVLRLVFIVLLSPAVLELWKLGKLAHIKSGCVSL